MAFATCGALIANPQEAREGSKISLCVAARIDLAESRTTALPVREIALVLLLALSVYILLAIASYSPTDPAWTFSGTDLTVSNLVGKSGAFAADVILFLFGRVSYLLPLALVVAGVKVLRPAPEPWTWPLFSIRFCGWLAVVVSACVLARLHSAPTTDLRAGPGGIIGDGLASMGLPVLGWVGLTLIAVVMLLIGAQAALGYSWIAVVEATGKGVHGVAHQAVAAIDAASRMARSLWKKALAVKPDVRRVAAAPKKRSTRRTTASNRSRTRSTAPGVGASPSLAVDTPGAAAETRKPVTEMPALDLLDSEESTGRGGFSDQNIEDMSRLLETKLADFGIEATVESVLPGPVVTRFEVQPAAGVKVSRITALAKDLARSLAVISVRIVEVIPGKTVVGIEIPNQHRETVRLREVLASDVYQRADSPLTLGLGKDISGESVIADISRMPHLLIAGTTGSGKSVGVNAMLLSMLYKATPEELRLILVDPKMLELSVYEGIPHLLTPVVTDMKDAATALNWCVEEMERRYRLMSSLGVRSLEGYNRSIEEAEQSGVPMVDPLWPEDAEEEAPPLAKEPVIVVVIDEFADLMMIVGKKVDQLIARVAQKARAAGIHLVLATQRPSVDVITGLIKANIPARMSYQVSSRVDSRTILDQGGAEQLLGYGDMLFLPPGTSIPVRVHGAFVSDEEVHSVVGDWKQRGSPDYRTEVLETVAGGPLAAAGDSDPEQSDELYDEAVAHVIETRRASISAVQRKLRIGYNRAARLIETMEAAGVVSTMDTNGSRQVLVPDSGELR